MDQPLHDQWCEADLVPSLSGPLSLHLQKEGFGPYF